MVTALLVSPARSATLYVDPGGNDVPPYASPSDASKRIQPAIDFATDGDTVLINGGTYSGAGNDNLTTRGKAIVVRGAGGPGAVKIRCAGAFGLRGRGFIITNHESASTVLEGLTIYGGWAPNDLESGGGILCDSGSSPTIRDCVFDSCRANSAGGALACFRGAQPYLLRVRFQRNAVAPIGGLPMGNGGAVYCNSSNPTFDQCSFDGNSAGRGGCLYCISSSPSIVNCMMVRNEAWGGLVVLDSNAGIGGACYLRQSSPLFVNTSINHNTATKATYGRGTGGGVAILVASSPQFVSCTIDGNVATGFDTSLGQGGGLYVSGSSSATLDKVIISNTQAGSAVYFASASASATATCSDLIGNVGGNWTGDLLDQLGNSGNVSLNPLFCDPSADSLTLLDHSPCAAAYSLCGETIGAMPVGCPSPCPIAMTGDVNSSSTINTADIVYLVNYVLRSGAVPMPCIAAGDVDCSGAVATADIVYLVNSVFKGGAAPCDVCPTIPGNWFCE